MGFLPQRCGNLIPADWHPPACCSEHDGSTQQSQSLDRFLYCVQNRVMGTLQMHIGHSAVLNFLTTLAVIMAECFQEWPCCRQMHPSTFFISVPRMTACRRASEDSRRSKYSFSLSCWLPGNLERQFMGTTCCIAELSMPTVIGESFLCVDAALCATALSDLRSQ